MRFYSYIVSLAEEQTDTGEDGWIDTTRGRARIDYDDEDNESSTYFRNRAAQGQKRKKTAFFNYSKKRKAYGNTSSSSKGSVVSLFHILSSSWRSYEAISFTEVLKPYFPLFFLLSCCGGVVDSVVATAAITRRRLVPEEEAGGPGAQREMEMHQQARDRASCLSQPLKLTSDPS